MPNNNPNLNINKESLGWITIREAVKKTNKKIKESDIYRHALYGDIFLSIYFQSPIILRKNTNNKP